ncbi:amine oxidase [Aspergillus egyptiacus]|nr:amine oxidase [Aspergillus egyptiacus]
MHLTPLFFTLAGSFQLGACHVAKALLYDPHCSRTSQALANASVTDFIIVEYRDTLGGRVWHTDFGKDANGDPYVVEFGANWIQGLGSERVENPVWRLAKKHGLRNTYSDYESILTYNETGYSNYSHVLDEYSQARKTASLHAGQILNVNLQDMTARSGLALAGWRPRHDDMAAQAVEWWNWDWEGASSPETSSFVFGIAGENLTFHQFGDENNLVLDARGYSAIIQGEADTFLEANNDDPRLRLNTIVSTIEHSPEGVIIRNTDGTCISAAYAICTFSLGVLQNDAVAFSPALPAWKQTAIHKFTMATYTKIFMQFSETFWPPHTQFLLYASPTTRGYYPVFQSLSTAGFLPGSNILFVTVVGPQAYRVERQPDAETRREILAVLREMFPDRTIPEPIAFAYPRWSTESWAYGSYSNWPAGTTLEMHQNLRANVGRLWFAGEATSAPYFGFLHGAWFEGREAGEQVAALLQRGDGECGGSGGGGNLEDGGRDCGRVHYEVLHGTTPIDAYSTENGWGVNSTLVMQA